MIIPVRDVVMIYIKKRHLSFDEILILKKNE